MQRNRRRNAVFRAVILQLVLVTAISLKYGLTHHPGWYKLLYVTLPLLAAANLYPYWKDVRFPVRRDWKRVKPFTLN